MSSTAPRSVSIERSGGFAGMKARVDLDGATLTPAQHAALASLVRGAGAGSAPAASPSARGADGFAYRVQVVDAAGTRTSFSVGESEMPDALGALCKPQLP